MRDPTRVSHRDLKAITVFVAATATPQRDGLSYLDAVLPAEHRLAATRAAIEADARLDGKFVLRTNTSLPPAEVGAWAGSDPGGHARGAVVPRAGVRPLSTGFTEMLG